jgi:hypothetical protein
MTNFLLLIAAVVLTTAAAAAAMTVGLYSHKYKIKLNESPPFFPYTIPKGTGLIHLVSLLYCDIKITLADIGGDQIISTPSGPDIYPRDS